MQKLSKSDIDYIVKDFPFNRGIPDETAKSILENGRRVLKNQLKDIEINPKDLKQFKDILTYFYEKSLSDPQTLIGPETALSLGCLYTQSVLNAFHVTGQSKLKSSELGRLEELLNITKNPRNKKSVVYFDKKYQNGTKKDIIRRIRRKCMKDIEYRTEDD